MRKQKKKERQIAADFLEATKQAVEPEVKEEPAVQAEQPAEESWENETMPEPPGFAPESPKVFQQTSPSTYQPTSPSYTDVEV